MDKNAIKKYAIWARRELIVRVTQKAEQYEITAKKITSADADSIGGRVLTAVEKKQRQSLIDKINQDGFEQVMEEVAYTWFNRFTALRFMEVNNYLPSRTRVFTNEHGEFKPQILADAIELDLDGLDMDKVYELKNANKAEELYKYLLITQCNALSAVLPRMFQKIEHYTELLLADYLLREGSVIEQMIALIPEEDWTDQVQIIGWLYQYYNTEPKDAVFAALKKNVKISKENIPAATQLFTPDWIVRYMVENSLGRLWLEGHQDSKKQFLPTKEEQSVYAEGERDSKDIKWHYYLEEAEQEPDVQKQLDMIRKEYAALKPEKIRCIDPCMGSGHILCYMFDVLVKIYEDYGYTVREAVENIVKKNLWGLDIDERAAQLSYFAVMMKARQYDRRFFNKKDENGNLAIPQPHVYAIQESNGLKYDGDYGDFLLGSEQQETLQYLFEVFKDAKEYGSILEVEQRDYDDFLNAWKLAAEQTLEDIRMIGWYQFAREKITALASQAKAMSQRYHVVVTNPPYMSISNANVNMQNYVKKMFPDSKSDLFAIFIEKCAQMIQKNGFQAMITQHAWMFLSSFEKLRKKIQIVDTVNMMHLGSRAFEEISGEVVQTTSFVMRKNFTENYQGIYCRLIEPTTQQGKENMFLSKENRYEVKQNSFDMIPGTPIAYWVSKNVIKAFDNEYISKYATSNGQNITGNNNKYLRLFWEVDYNNINKEYWVKCARGGGYRKYYGNDDNVILWTDAARKHYRQDSIARIVPDNLRFKSGITWSYITSGVPSFRKLWEDELFEKAGTSIFINNTDYLNEILGLLNSTVSRELLKFINPTINYQVRDIFSIPVEKDVLVSDDINKLVEQNINIEKIDWDSFETSWDFQQHPLLCKVATVAEAFKQWQKKCDNCFKQLKTNEEELNRIFIDIYGLQDELTPEVEDKDVTVRKADLQRDIRSLISYAVGCMFGRYSLDVPGLSYAGGEWETSKYKTFLPDKDAIIPICDDEYFEDDIVGRFVQFIEVVYGKETLEENLKFIADALSGKGASREVIRNYFMNDFYADHLKVYQKRPIYWLFDSGKKNGFKCLIYMHRYQPDTIARIRTDYVHEQQSRYRTAIADLEQRINGASTSERVKLNKQLTKLQAQAAELREYEEKIHHLADQMISIDLDDGVKVNYAKFQDVLAKIK